VTGQAARTTLSRRVYYIAAVLLALAVARGASPASGQVELTITPTMVKGSADAPVTIVEFSDYQ
jgi:protein-disulfide isomerase